MLVALHQALCGYEHCEGRALAWTSELLRRGGRSGRLDLLLCLSSKKKEIFSSSSSSKRLTFIMHSQLTMCCARQGACSDRPPPLTSEHLVRSRPRPGQARLELPGASDCILWSRFASVADLQASPEPWSARDPSRSALEIPPDQISRSLQLSTLARRSPVSAARSRARRAAARRPRRQATRSRARPRGRSPPTSREGSPARACRWLPRGSRP